MKNQRVNFKSFPIFTISYAKLTWMEKHYIISNTQLNLDEKQCTISSAGHIEDEWNVCNSDRIVVVWRHGSLPSESFDPQTQHEECNPDRFRWQFEHDRCNKPTHLSLSNPAQYLKFQWTIFVAILIMYFPSSLRLFRLLASLCSWGTHHRGRGCLVPSAHGNSCADQTTHVSASEQMQSPILKDQHLDPMIDCWVC